MITCEHIELATDDANRARDFYAKLFGWTIDGMPDGHGGEYLMFRTDNGAGGITGKMAPQQPTAWMPYFTVPSVKASLTAAGKLGAAVDVPYTPMGGMGAIAVVRDPTGASFGLYERAAKPAEAKPAPKAGQRKPAAKATQAKPAAKATQAKPAAKATPAKPGAKAAPTKAVAQAKPASKKPARR